MSFTIFRVRFYKVEGANSTKWPYSSTRRVYLDDLADKPFNDIVLPPPEYLLVENGRNVNVIKAKEIEINKDAKDGIYKELEEVELAIGREYEHVRDSLCDLDEMEEFAIWLLKAIAKEKKEP